MRRRSCLILRIESQAAEPQLSHQSADAKQFLEHHQVPLAARSRATPSVTFKIPTNRPAEVAPFAALSPEVDQLEIRDQRLELRQTPHVAEHRAPYQPGVG